MCCDEDTFGSRSEEERTTMGCVNRDGLARGLPAIHDPLLYLQYT